MPTFMLIAQDPQGGPIAIHAGSDHASDELVEEIERWGWDVLSGSARLLSLTEARREALQENIRTFLRARPYTLEELVAALREAGFGKLKFARARAELHQMEANDRVAFENMTYSWIGD